MPANGLCLELTHTGLSASSLPLSDVVDGMDPDTSYRKPGPVSIPVGATVQLVYSSSVAVSFETGSIRRFIERGHLTAQFVFGTDFSSALPAGGSLTVLDDGVSLGNYTSVNFIGADVLAQDSGTPNQVNIYIPPPVFLSHWDQNDGSNGDQSVTDTLVRTTARIANPSGGQGSPFRTNGWEGTDQDATDQSTVTLTTPGSTTGFGGDSTMTIVVRDATGSIVGGYLTPVITGNGSIVDPSGNITVTISGYAPDATRFSAKAEVLVDFKGILDDAGQSSGGRFHIEVTHTTDSSTDGTGPYTYTMSDVFYDIDPTTPTATGLTIAETGGAVVTKHISGLEYYDLGSDFTVDVADIDQINRNVARSTANLVLTGTEYGLPTLNHSPFGTGSANFTGYTFDHDQDNLTYQFTAWEINSTNHRYIGPTANVTAFAQDPWNAQSPIASSDASVLVDTYVDNATDTFEDFRGESRLENSSFTLSRDSTVSLVAGEAMVFNDRLMSPEATTYIRSDGPNSANTDWTGYSPTAGGANPDYTGLTVPVSAYRRFPDATGLSRSSMSIVFSGTSAGANFLADLVSSDLEVFVYRISGGAGSGAFGPPPGNTQPLSLHGAAFNFATFDDGVTDGQIREGTSSGNTINATFGSGTFMEDGIYCHIRINDPAIQIDSMTVTFIS